MVDIDDPTCTGNSTITTANCANPCVLSNLNASTGNSTTHVVLVEDFAFNPVNITITDGDIVEWQWVGAVDHTATSDSTSGPNSWDSGLLGNGATYQSPALFPGIHPYYCVPHGGPDGVGMAGTITVQPDCNNGEVAVNLTFDHMGGSFDGFDVLVDGNNVGNYAYDPSGTTSLTINVIGNGQNHTIQIVDVGNPACSTNTTIFTPNCDAMTCQISLFAEEVGPCENDSVWVEVTINDLGGGASGFTLTAFGEVDTFNYSGTGTTIVEYLIPGNGGTYYFLAEDLEHSNCQEIVQITTSDCLLPCELTNLELYGGGGNPTTHIVEVKDFEFDPQIIEVNVGDIVQWDWTGVIPHTSTSDATSGPDSWDSGFLGQGETYSTTISSEGVHPYYCIPHGGPGGVGMAGSITAVPAIACDSNGMVTVIISFEVTNPGSGFEVHLDGNLIDEFSYSSGTNIVEIQVDGDGQVHTITITDLGTPDCSISGEISVPDCSASEPCDLAMTATLTGDCDANDQVEISLEITDTGGSDAGFNVLVDGNLYPGGPFGYDNSGTTNLALLIAGTGTERTIEVVDVDSSSCLATAEVLTPLCGVPCEILNLAVSGNEAGKHIVLVEDFEFIPAYVEVVLGDTVEFVWTGIIPHTATSDATTGPSSWDSGLEGEGFVYQVVMTEIGTHPYYCTPHGGPGGIGMAGVIEVLEPCDNGQASVSVNFEVTNGSPLGYNVFLDGNYLAGPILYDDPEGFNSTIVSVPGDMATHLLTVQDMDIGFCAATVAFETPECEVLCEIQDLEALTGTDIVHTVAVKDFEFEPLELNVRTGQTVLFDFVGEIPHTTTSDAIAGTDSWDSGLLGQNDQYELVVQTSGEHPYYCIPHGGPGGIGMAGVLFAEADCENGLVAVEIQFSITSGSAEGYNVYLDGTLLPGSPFAYDDPAGVNSTIIEIAGDGETHLITVQDMDVAFCAATVQVEVADCNAACSITGLEAEVPINEVHVVEVKDFEFEPQEITIELGDTVRFVWTGQIDHTATSDIISGTDAFDSGLLGTGAVYDLVLTTEGFHPYYCIPHGGPGGIGMAGSITVEDTGCQNGNVAVDLSFMNASAGNNGFNVYVDDSLYVGSPFDYDANGNNVITISVPGNGMAHNIVIADADDLNCADTTTVVTPNCSTDCALSLNAVQVGDCNDDDEIPYQIQIVSQNAQDSFNLEVDGIIFGGSPFTYLDNDSTTIDLMLVGDGNAHLIVVTDIDSLGCTDTLSIVTPDCTPNCQLNLAVVQTGDCDDNQEVVYELEITALNQGANGFNLYVDGMLDAGSPFSYSGMTTITQQTVLGDGSNYEFVVADVDDPSCVDTMMVTSPDCSLGCMLSGLEIEIGAAETHVVEVLDFVFDPIQLTIEVEDTVRWVWTGEIPHTATSDAISGDDVWNSGLLGQGEVYDYVIQTVGEHPYYCVPHGAPGGVGMAANITAVDPCEDNMLTVSFRFAEVNGSQAGYNVYIDGNLVVGSPFDYSTSGVNVLFVEMGGDGQSHLILIEDAAMPDCSVEEEFTMPDCGDPCFDFDAEFITEIDHLTYEVEFICLNTDAASWLWTFGTGDASTIQFPNYTYEEPGEYEICISIEDGMGCEAENCDTIVVGTYQCEANFEYEIDGLEISFTDLSITTDSITDWEWNFGNGISLNGMQHPTYQYDDLGEYEVCLTIFAGTACLDDTCMVLDLSDPCLAFVPDYAFTINLDDLSVQFIDLTSGSPDQWLWGFGDGNTSNDQNPLHYYDQPGAYNVCLLVQDTELGCNESYCEVAYVGVSGTADPTGRNHVLTVFPNPASTANEEWYVQGILPVDWHQELEVKLYDVRGKTLYTHRMAGSDLMVLRPEVLQVAGVYFLELKGEAGVYRAKLVVQ